MLNTTRKKIIALIVAVIAVFSLAACSHSSDVASQNLSNQADNFQVFRQIVVYDTFTSKYVEAVYGYCAQGNADTDQHITFVCKSAGGYTKDIINMTTGSIVLIHQMHPIGVSQDFYQVTLKPSTIIPDFKFQE